jgi:hypothetical protein
MTLNGRQQERAQRCCWSSPLRFSWDVAAMLDLVLDPADGAGVSWLARERSVRGHGAVRSDQGGYRAAQILYGEPNRSGRELIRNVAEMGAVARLVGKESGVVSGVINLESSGVSASDWRPRHDKYYHEA